MDQPLVTLGEAGADAQILFAARPQRLHPSFVHSNALPSLQAQWRKAYASRIVHPAAIVLYRLPAGTLLCGAGFATSIGDAWLAEQLIPGADRTAIAHGFATLPVQSAPGHETLLIARFGEGTWGHWLIELLPKLLVAETAFPGRFHYAIPGWVLHEPVLGARIRESIAACGVTQDRLLAVPSDATLCFDRLFALSPVHTDHALHPDVAAAMRRMATACRPAELPRKLALRRHDARRSIANLAAILPVLEKRRFHSIDIGTLDFATQCAVFTRAHTLFSVLGSGLAGLVFSPDGTRVCAAGPDGFGDRFFIGLLQQRPGTLWAEARGPIQTADAAHARDSSFQLAPESLRAALDALGV